MQDQLTRLVDAVPGLIWTVSPDGYADFFSRRWLEFTGLSGDEARGHGWQRAVHPDDVLDLLAACRAYSPSDQTWEVAVRLSRSGGSFQKVLFTFSAFGDDSGAVAGWCGIGIEKRDEGRVQNPQQLRDEHFRLIADLVPAMIVSMSPTGEVTSVNRAALEYFGSTLETIKNWIANDVVHADDLLATQTAWFHAVQSGEPYDIALRLRRFDGVYRWFRAQGEAVRDARGRITGWYLLQTDIENVKQTEESLHASVGDLVQIIQTFPTTVWSARPDGYCDFVNQRWLEYAGLPAQDALGWGYLSVIHPDDAEATANHWRSCLKTGSPIDWEARMRRFDGVYRRFIFRGNPLRDESGNIIKWFGTNIDIEDRKRAEEARERDLIGIVDTIPTTAWITRPDGYVEFLNRRWLEYTGFSAEQAQGFGWAACIHPDDVDELQAYWQGRLATGVPVDTEARMRRYDGVYRWFLFRANPLRDEHGDIIRWYGTNIDIEDRKRSDEAVRANEQSLKQIIDAIPAAAWASRLDGYSEFQNKSWLEYAGLTAEQAEGWAWVDVIHPDDVDGLREHWQATLATGDATEAEARMRRHDGVYRWFLFRANPLRDESGQLVKWYGTNFDIEDRKQAEAELRRSETFLAEGQRLSATGSFAWHPDRDEFTFSEELHRIFEFEPGMRITLADFLGRVHPDDKALVGERKAAARAGAKSLDYEARLVMPNGSIKIVHTIAYGTHDRNNRVEIIGAVQDVTERRLADEAVGNIRSELARVARITSFGALTATISHEINQPLAGVITNAGTCLRLLDGDPPDLAAARMTVQRIVADGKRASDVVSRLRQLFSRKSSVVERVYLSEAAREVIALSRSELQKHRAIVRAELDDNVPPIMGDRVQLQQVILNLLLNAADAMSDVEDRPRQMVVTTRRHDGDSVLLTVRDAGVGIAHNAEQLFEPFYTTKDGGMGIGLSISNSIVQGHRGQLWVTPNDGPGVTFSMSIPYTSN